jgi:hypothetical protein
VRELLAFVLLITVVGMWVVMPWRQETVLRLFNAESEEELVGRILESRQFMASMGLVILLDVAAVALALIILI